MSDPLPPRSLTHPHRPFARWNDPRLRWTMTPTLESCRALLACGITGQFEAWHEGDSFARLTGDIANVAKLEVKEGPVRFVRYQLVATSEQVLQTRPDSPPVSDSYAAGV